MSVSLLPDAQFLAWGWRIPFLASVVLIVIGLVIRLSLSESPDFAALRERCGCGTHADCASRSASIGSRSSWSRAPTCPRACSPISAWPTSCPMAQPSPKSTTPQALFGVFVARAGGRCDVSAVRNGLSDRLGRKPVSCAGVVLMGVAIAPAFALINTGKPALVYRRRCSWCSAFAMAPAAGVTGSLFTMVFDADVRYSGVSIGYTLSQVLGSAFARPSRPPCTPRPRRAIRSSPT